MELDLLSTKFTVKRIEEADLSDVYALCKGNPLYYQHCPPEVTIDNLREDITALPPGSKVEDKYYIGFYLNGSLAAVMDLILGYPEALTAWIGFFMTEQKLQGQGIGTTIIEEVCQSLRQSGFANIGLGFVKGNPQCEHFWKKNYFEQTGTKNNHLNMS